jgi:hypothetical protein
MEQSGTTILLNIKGQRGTEMVLVVDYETKTASLLTVNEGGVIYVKEVKDYTKKGH